MLGARHFLVSGRVQGVGFRYFVREAALFEHVTGWVRNLPDGRVESVAEGARNSLDRFEAQLRLGPPRSRIDAVDVTDRPHTGKFTTFRIERD